MESSVQLMAGIPATNAALYHRLRFAVGDPVAVIDLPDRQGSQRTLIVRDIEMHRARQQARADHVACPADFTPESGLSGDRETATAQAAAECLRRHDVRQVVADRTLPLIYVEAVREVGISIQCDLQLGVDERRSKDAQEIVWIQQAQQDTEAAMQLACSMIAEADVNVDGILQVDGAVLTAERVRARIDYFLLDRGYANPPAIVASGAQGGDCHHLGKGPIRTGEPVIVDIFPRNQTTRYNGDCTRTVVHGEISEELARMHATVLAAKDAAERATRAGVSGEAVHDATRKVILDAGYRMGLPGAGDADSYCSMPHGTGHGLGLEVHEPPLLDQKGPTLVAGDVLTIEPGLYRRDLGGVRVEDMVVVHDDGCENLNRLPTGLTWS